MRGGGARWRGLRRGVSLTELIVVLAVLGIAAAAVGRTSLGQQEHYRDFSGRMRARAILREGSAVLTAELRGIAPGAGDLYAEEMRDASIAFRSTVGAFTLCDAAVPGTSSIDIVDLHLADGVATVAGAPFAPSPGDSLWLYDSGADIGGADDGWLPHLVAGVSVVRRACGLEPSAADGEAFRLSLAGPVHAVTESHAPVRLFRRVRYTLYAAADGLWYLGFSDCRPLVRNPPCATLQPIAGPYEPYRAGTASVRSGLLLRYLDRGGHETTDPHAVAMIELDLRTRSLGAGRFARDVVERHTIALRNAVR